MTIPGSLVERFHCRDGFSEIILECFEMGEPLIVGKAHLFTKRPVFCGKFGVLEFLFFNSFRLHNTDFYSHIQQSHIEFFHVVIAGRFGVAQVFDLHCRAGGGYS